MPSATPPTTTPTRSTIRASGDNVVIVSEPLDKDRSIWTPVPTNHVLIARDGERVELRPFFGEKRQAAE